MGPLARNGLMIRNDKSDCKIIFAQLTHLSQCTLFLPSLSTTLFLPTLRFSDAFGGGG